MKIQLVNLKRTCYYLYSNLTGQAKRHVCRNVASKIVDHVHTELRNNMNMTLQRRVVHLTYDQLLESNDDTA